MSTFAEALEHLETQAGRAEEEREARLVQAVAAHEAAAVRWADTMGQAPQAELLRAHHALARAEGYVLQGELLRAISEDVVDLLEALRTRCKVAALLAAGVRQGSVVERLISEAVDGQPLVDP